MPTIDDCMDEIRKWTNFSCITYIVKENKQIKLNIYDQHFIISIFLNIIVIQQNQTYTHNNTNLYKLLEEINNNIEKYTLTTILDIIYERIKNTNIIKANMNSKIDIDPYSSVSLFVPQVIKNIVIKDYYQVIKNQDNRFTIKLQDIYNWTINYNNIGQNKLDVSLILSFNKSSYPTSPPNLKVITQLDNNLDSRLEKLHIIHKDYWTPSRSIISILNKLYNILDKHATKSNNIYTRFDELEFVIHDNLDNKNHLNTIDEETYTKVKSIKTIWNNGTGFGSSSNLSDWDIKTYIDEEQNRNNKIKLLLRDIIKDIEINKFNNTNPNQISNICSYIISSCNNITLLELNRYSELYLEMFNFIVSLENHQYQNTTNKIYDLIKYISNLYKSSNKYNILDETIDDMQKIYHIINKLENIIPKPQDNSIEAKPVISIKTIQDDYTKNMCKLRDTEEEITIDLSENTNYCFKQKFIDNKNIKLSHITRKRINYEISTFNLLPVSLDALIISLPDTNYPNVIRTLITGPQNTPYENGCFFFDTYLNNSFPTSPPNVWFLNTGKKRMNPNLYNNGQVCLSLLGTWRGQESEKWNPEISSINQVYKSIQSQILIDQPFFNEPGYEIHYNTLDGIEKSKKYNDTIRLYTMRHTILEIIENKKIYRPFEDILDFYFKSKKEHILETCIKWMSSCPEDMKSDYQSVYDNIVKLLS
jgi:ubiquitin-protein ligase